MEWLFILLASIFEMIGVIGLKLASQQKSLHNSVMYVGGFCASVALLYQAFAYLPVSVAYAVWVGIGTAGAVSMNMIFFGESRNLSRMISLLAIIIGVIGLRALS
ncbi:QacE family quaternary ammonium compound efflux SMR transporter [Lentibacillus kapialis]|uniref:QacE family quaternary ammonium compound efflux SMR transporter n=1 Tax=Lentibacillus kapialis TaxID=340214 RepID=A0A917PKI8_9BACI|nr:multidrug efflux SMR transporter [Lentibacillus kapialis]GGJ82305.1 QacE family quaternary ammonium compound efflux SMR transporter [Lentibacillus kapialis]